MSNGVYQISFFLKIPEMKSCLVLYNFARRKQIPFKTNFCHGIRFEFLKKSTKCPFQKQLMQTLNLR
jgi:hypothetical protein